jgi:small multidrug resistance family-3 protein
MSFLDRIVSIPAGAFIILALAALLEALGDSYFQVAFYRSAGVSRVLWFIVGTLVLASYGSVVNIPRWDFGKLLGVYVVLFFIMAQVLNKIRFQQSPTTPIYVGGSLIVAGGLVIAFWKP